MALLLNGSRRRSGRPLSMVPCSLAAVIALAGCGGDEEVDKTREATDRPGISQADGPERPKRPAQSETGDSLSTHGNRRSPTTPSRVPDGRRVRRDGPARPARRYRVKCRVLETKRAGRVVSTRREDCRRERLKDVKDDQVPRPSPVRSKKD